MDEVRKATESLMQQHTLEGNGNIDGPSHVDIADSTDVVATVATVAVVGIGAAIFEAALLPGIALGVAAMWLSRYYAKMGEALEPLFEPTVSGVNTANAAVNVFKL